MIKNLNDFKIVSINVRGLRDAKRRVSLFNWLRRQHFDVIFIQETHSEVDCEIKWQNEWGGKIIMSHGSSNSKGTMIMFRRDLDVSIKFSKCHQDGRIVLVNCDIMEENINFASIYAPNIEAEQLLFYDELEKCLNENNINSEDMLIIGGDWNIVQNPEIDKMGGLNTLKLKSLDKLDKLKNSFSLNDTWRIKNPDTRRYTWRQKTPLIQCRLDFFLISDHLFDNITDMDIIPSLQADHSAITCNYASIPNVRKGPGLWKFNNSLLNDVEYTEYLKLNISFWIDKYSNILDKRVKWELIKYEIRKFTIDYCKKKTRARRNRENELEKKLISLEKTLDYNNMKEYHEVKNELVDIELEKIEGMMIRSKVEWYEKGEKSTKYFLSLEKTNSIKKHMRKLKLLDGTITTDPNEILKEQQKFYKKLLSTKLNKDQVNEYENNYFFNSKNIPKLSNQEKKACEGLITNSECLKIINTFKKNSSPGNDGISIEFYVQFWNLISVVLIESFNYAYEKGELSNSQKQAIITLIHKKDKDRLYIDNWRPISLLNVDYKIMSKVIAERVKKVLSSLINLDQSGFLMGRYIGDSVRTLMDIIDICKIHNIRGLLMMLDFKKAYDSIEFPFLYKVLRKFNFGSMLVKWIKLFYTNIESCVTNNQITSQYFNVTRGLRQGDPLSSYLFILCVEILSISVRNNDEIKGIKINKEFKLAQYADDTTAILSDIESIRPLFREIELFGTISGLELNKEKTQVMPLGPNIIDHDIFKERLDNIFNRELQSTIKPVKVLGIYISNSDEDVIEANFKPNIKKLKAILNQWKRRKLSLIGKILILKTFGISQFIYLSNLISFPKKYILEIEQILYEFIWGNKSYKVKKGIMIQEYDLGGLKMPDLDTIVKVQKCKWIIQYLNNHSGQWQYTIKKLIGIELLEIFLLSNFDIKDFPSIPTFYKEVLQSWATIKSSIDNSQVGEQFIFYNKIIKINNQYIYNKDFLNCGIWKIKDLFYSNGKIISFDVWKQRGLNSRWYLLWRGIIEIIKSKNIDPRVHNKKENELNHINRVLKVKSKYLYNALIKTKIAYSVAKDKFRDILKLEENDNLWKFVYLIPHGCVNNNNVKELQYKILHRYFPTNVLLSKIYANISNDCTFCSLEKETLEHLFFECKYVKLIWQYLEDHIKNVIHTQIVLSLPNILLGMMEEDINRLDMINCLILHGKYFIAKCKFMYTIPNTKNFYNYLVYHKKYETLMKDFLL